MADVKAQFEEMLSLDRAIYEKLVIWKAFLNDLGDRVRRFESEGNSQASTLRILYTKSTSDYFTQFDAYNKRQNDYRTNKLLNYGKDVQEWVDKKINYWKEVWNKVVSGKDLQAAPLLIPVVIIGASAAVITASGYFVKEYFVETRNSLPKVTKALAEIQKTNPTLADNIINKAAELEADSIKAAEESSFQAQLGKGIKYAVWTVTALAMLLALYEVSKKHGLL